MRAESIARRRRRWLVRGLTGTGGAALAFVAVMGFLHTPAGRPFMRRLGMTCPARAVTPAAAEALRMRGARELRGPAPAPVRPALGLDLDRARLADVQQWAAARGASCTARARPSSLLSCRQIPSYDEVTFGFAPDGRLISVSALRTGLPGTEAAERFDVLQRSLSAQLGAGTLAGQATAGALAGGPLHTARLQYRFSDYLATVTAMNLAGGIALREQYQSARD
ncbi:MAG TPA: hypothetical protein VHM31_04650 [Polyangia bacterium]|nr:hypothetical protein [Polyangia bacterium]